jgi:hypothetical protein
MKVLGIIASPEDPASRIRISQYKKWFHKNGEKLDDIYFKPQKEEEPSQNAIRLSRITSVNKWRIWNTYKNIARFPLLSKQYKYDVLWQSRLLIPENYSLERFYRMPLVFDFDDAIWINEGQQHVIKAIQKADKIFAGNPYLAEFASKYNSSVIVIPTTVDLEINYPIKKEQNDFTVGWIGTPGNFPYLETIKNVLLEFLRKNKDAQLLIVSSIPPSFLPFDNKQILFRKWQAEIENELVNKFSVGVMPLPDNDWTRGKCGYKVLQYMACNIPFIASPTGINGSLIEKSQGGLSATTEAEWLLKFQELKDDSQLTTALSKTGRAFVETHYSAKKWTSEIIGQMKQII